MTSTFTESQVSSGFIGCFDLVTSPGKRHFQTAGGGNNVSLWAYMVKGTDARWVCGSQGNPFWVIVDGNTPVNPATSNGSISLFSGLTDTWHFIQVYSDGGYSPVYNWTFTTGALLSVSGSAPAVSAVGPAFMLTDPLYPGRFSGQVAYAKDFCNWAQAGPSYPCPSIVIRGGATRFKAKCTRIYAFTGDNAAQLGIDGANLSKVQLARGLRCWQLVADNLDISKVHEYTLTTGSSPNGGSSPNFAIMLGGVGAEFETIDEESILEIGDSIAYGAGSDDTCDVATFQYAQGFDYVPSVYGVSGIKTADLLTEYNNHISKNWNHKPKVIVIAIGRNDSENDGTLTGNYAALIQACLLSVGSDGIIICRLPTPNFVNVNPNLIAAINAVNDPRVHLIDSSGWMGIATIDGTHPTTAGYVVLANYEASAFKPILHPTFTYTQQVSQTLQLSNDASAIKISKDPDVPIGIVIPVTPDTSQSPFKFPQYLKTSAADQYFYQRLNSDTWFSAREGDKNASLVQSTRAIDSLRFKGIKFYPSQKLEFPRRANSEQRTQLLFDRAPWLNYRYLGEVESVRQMPGQMPDIPQDILIACCENAIMLLDGFDFEQELSQLNAQHLNYATIRETYDRTMAVTHVRCGIASGVAWQKLVPWLEDAQSFNLSRV